MPVAICTNRNKSYEMWYGLKRSATHSLKMTAAHARYRRAVRPKDIKSVKSRSENDEHAAARTLPEEDPEMSASAPMKHVVGCTDIKLYFERVFEDLLVYYTPTMDDYYDHQQAALAIEHWNKKLSEVDAPFSEIGLTLPANRMDPRQVSTMKDVPGGGARTVFHANTSAEIEAVFTVVGALTVKDLPPVNRTRAREIGAKRLRQHATIVGYDSLQFQRAIDNIQIVAYEMSRVFGDDDLRIWRPDATEAQKTTFNLAIDPHKALDGMLSTTVHHCYDNSVSYLTLENGTYTSHPPNAFKIGDIVEMGFTINAWRLAADNNGPKYNTNLVLRTLTFLDGTFSRNAALHRLDSERRSAAAEPLQMVPVIRNQIAFRIAKRKDRQREPEADAGEPSLRHKMIQTLHERVGTNSSDQIGPYFELMRQSPDDYIIDSGLLDMVKQCLTFVVSIYSTQEKRRP
ncbi:hypothetical protein B0H12DRAFT_1078863 [Mycena haematopus]|nr:hypothetical protein B0H12DRAFT_1078863 [Mycena haematopus]